MISRAIPRGAAEYPPPLRELSRAPDPLHVVGELPRGPAVAIVGTRSASREGMDFARGLAAELAREGVAVLSGGAEGIDTAAHLGALDGGGATVVVAASGAERPFPSSNIELFRRVVREGGAYAGAFAPHVEARRFRFLQRNHVLVALCSVLVVIEARRVGGARHAALAARALGRPVLVVPCAPWSTCGAGSAELLRDGMRAMTRAADVLELLGVPRRGAQLCLDVPANAARGTGRVTPDPQLALVLAALQAGADDPDALCAATGLGPGRVQALLLTLTLEGIVVSGPSGRLVITSP